MDRGREKAVVAVVGKQLAGRLESGKPVSCGVELDSPGKQIGLFSQ